ncbi:MAG: ArsA family ATPase [Acidimicrobiales bacterium]
MSASDPQGARLGSLDRLLASHEMALVCGAGGVGKTTIAASLATMAACNHRGRVLVLTIDPAKRLADALGVGAMDNHEHRVALDRFSEAGLSPRGELWAAMLDTEASWEALVARHAPDESTREKILSNPLFRNIAARFVQSHDYIAAERLFELHSGGDYDLIVVDTPPSRHALDFLDAPGRMSDFFSSRLLRWLVMPSRSRLLGLASKPFHQIAQRVLGEQFLGDVSQFFALLQTMQEGFTERARAVARLLSDSRTSFVVVSSLETAPLKEARGFADELGRRGLHLGAIVVNRVLPSYMADPSLLRTARELSDRAAALAAALPTDTDLSARVLSEAATSFSNFNLVATMQSERIESLAKGFDVIATAPAFPQGVASLEGLVALGETIWT